MSRKNWKQSKQSQNLSTLKHLFEDAEFAAEEVSGLLNSYSNNSEEYADLMMAGKFLQGFLDADVAITSDFAQQINEQYAKAGLALKSDEERGEEKNAHRLKLTGVCRIFELMLTTHGEARELIDWLVEKDNAANLKLTEIFETRWSKVEGLENAITENEAEIDILAGNLSEGHATTPTPEDRAAWGAIGDVRKDISEYEGELNKLLDKAPGYELVKSLWKTYCQFGGEIVEALPKLDASASFSASFMDSRRSSAANRRRSSLVSLGGVRAPTLMLPQGVARAGIPVTRTGIMALRGELRDFMASVEAAQDAAQTAAVDLSMAQSTIESEREAAEQSNSEAIQQLDEARYASEVAVEKAQATQEAANKAQEAGAQRKAELEALERQLSKKKIVLAEKERKLDETALDVERQTLELADLKEMVAGDQTKLSEEKMVALAVKQEAEGLKAEAETAQVAAQAEKEAAETDTVKAKDASAKVAAAQEKLESGGKELDEMQKNLTAERGTLEAGQAVLKGEREVLSEQKTAFSASQKEFQEEAQQQRESFSEQEVALQQLKVETQAGIAQLKTHLQKADAERDTATQQVAALQEKLKAVLAEVGVTKQQLEAAAGEVKEAKAETAEVKQELEGFSSRSAEHEKELAEVKESLESKQKAFVEVSQSASSVEAEHGTATAENDKLKQELTDAKNEAKSAKQRMEQLNKKAGEDAVALDGLEKRVQAVQEEKETAEGKLGATESQVATLIDQKSGADGRALRLQAQLDAKPQELLQTSGGKTLTAGFVLAGVSTLVALGILASLNTTMTFTALCAASPALPVLMGLAIVGLIIGTVGIAMAAREGAEKSASASEAGAFSNANSPHHVVQSHEVVVV